MTPYNRVLVLVGGAALIASLTIAAVFVQTNSADATLRSDQAGVHTVQTLGDGLLSEVHEQREALDEYLMSGDPRPLAQFDAAVLAEAQAADQISLGVGAISGDSGSGLKAALIAVDAENDTWRATVAGPAVAAVQTGSLEGVEAAIALEAGNEESSQGATAKFVLEVDAFQTQLQIRAAALDDLRAAALAVGIVIVLITAGLSLWFVRRFGITVLRDIDRRDQSSAARITIVASLRTLRVQPTPEGTAMTIATALMRLPGADVAGVFECAPEGLRAMAVVASAPFPIATGQLVPEVLARHLVERSSAGPWAEAVPRYGLQEELGRLYAEVGMQSRAFAPIEVDGVLVGLIGLATTDPAHGRDFLEELPAVGSFATVAEAILAPALIARRARTEQQQCVDTVISTAAFHPVFQPVLALATGVTVGFEALTRFDDGTRPDIMFATAIGCGMGIELEKATIAVALRESRQLPADAWLSLNVSPRLLALPHAVGELLADATRPIVLEVTEHEVIESYADLREAMHDLGPAVRLAVDDTGAGVANFHHLAELRPDFLKIDISLVRGLDADRSRRAVVVGLVHFAAESGCQVLAEGVETAAERATVADLGVTLGQGYLLGRPALAETWRDTVVTPAAPRLLLLPGSRRLSPSVPAGASVVRKVIPA